MKHVTIVHNPVSENSKEDEVDVIDQAKLIEKALPELGYDSVRMDFRLDIQHFSKELKSKSPSIIFNLVETVNNQGRLSFIAPAVFDSLGVKYTGSGTNAIFTTTDKIICKTILRNNKISTPDWAKNVSEIDPLKTYLLKPVSEDGSVGIEDAILYKGKQIDVIPKDYFAEEYIDGREFNISIIGGIVLPPAEMCFLDYSPERPKILGYKSKWKENSFEYKNTERSFNFEEKDNSLLKELKDIVSRCWDLFNLKGYARVDFRVGIDNIPRVIDINANPCIAPESGFIAACHQAGLTNAEIIKRIIKDAERD
jgi:D-alanine-D-alanine ligase